MYIFLNKTIFNIVKEKYGKIGYVKEKDQIDKKQLFQKALKYTTEISRK